MLLRFTLFTLALTAVVAFLVGAILAGGVARSSVAAGPTAKPADPHPPSRAAASPTPAAVPTFADVVARINSAVVNIDATTKGRDPRTRRPPNDPGSQDPFNGPQGYAPRRDFDAPRRGAGSGFII